ncbi:hypothetical protein [Paracoccus aeridis]|uniref:hypothetical protein n=1 Tax=Paracoccus aeridis TaxID=1966466 RepID=UPI0010A9E8AD|nr:hypothetical protein [Paracoccus aeridis]
MIAFVKRLDEAGAALDRHDPETALTLLQSLEDGGRTLDQADAARCRRLVQRMATIAEAQRQGIKAAIDGVTAARRAAASLQTYDNSGRRQIETTAFPKARRF